MYGSYVVDVVDKDNVVIFRNELYDLLNKFLFYGILLFVLGNKIDKFEVILK